ncbi:hypothetical protein VTN31DRAFT_1127 [Thermomyces dupontii]|uniref:uncharacterized protein n=1 Tax=Talaromyces thermophilus TaxID=28565 RepID=UPI003743D09D
MSIEIDWQTATSGPDGEQLAERIRAFIHDRFQQVPLPRFIRSVQVHSFDFGRVAPELEIKDICDPFADFYEEDNDDDDDDDDGEEEEEDEEDDKTDLESNPSPSNVHNNLGWPYSTRQRDDRELNSPPTPFGLAEHVQIARSGSPAIPGGTSNVGYHHLMLGGLSGTQTPLAAAVAGASSFPSRFQPGPSDARRVSSPTEETPPGVNMDVEEHGSPSRPSTANTNPSGLSHGHQSAASDPTTTGSSGEPPTTTTNNNNNNNNPDPARSPRPSPRPRHSIREQQRPEDFQVLCHVKYAGDIKLSLTAEILLDYPMPSFVGLPLKLNITGMTFDGVAVVAYIRRRWHLCFLAPEDADALLGPDHQRDGHNDAPGHTAQSQRRYGSSSLLQHIRVESEIGRQENGKQVLKNVGKVERFVLEQVRRIFEDELVYPSYWTFLT